MAANLAAKAERAAAEAEARAKSTLSNAHLEGGGVHGSVWGSEGAADAELDADKVGMGYKDGSASCHIIYLTLFCCACALQPFLQHRDGSGSRLGPRLASAQRVVAP